MSNSRLMDSVKSQPIRTFSRLKLYAAVLAATQCIATGQAWAGPEGGEVVGGEGIIQQAGVETIITQATDRMAIDWRSFDVAANERVEFIQPDSSSIALNRVLSNRGSEILGRIDANGQVMLVNSNGVVFGKDSVVNVGGMIASGLNIDPTSFINGDFALNSIDGAEGKVINYGIINAATGGSVTLMGEQVRNDGLISAKLGAVNLVAGNAAVLTFDPSGMVGVKVTDAVVQDELGVDAAVINNGTINAQGGRVLLSASVSEDVFSSAVNNSGMNKTSSVVVHDDGSFTLGAGADVLNTGDISVSTTEGNAGQVVALGSNITHSGSISADTSKGTGGSIELHSTDTTLLTENSTVSAQANAQGEGGDVKVLGNKVGLFDKAEVNASGANGGGQVLIGGDKTGQNEKIRNADFIYLSKDSAVKTDALINGDGGKLITFASDTARLYGNLYSRGGSLGGNGGFIETSGLKGFEILNSPDMSAKLGVGGLWLIDPYNITIISDGPGFDDFDTNLSPFISSSNSELSVDAIIIALSNGNVRVETGTDGELNDGWIHLDAELTYSGTPTRTLTFSAHNGIEINQGIDGRLNLVLDANSDNNGTGNILVKSEFGFDTKGGFIQASGINFSLDDGGNTGIETNGGAVTLNMKGVIDIKSNIITANGAFTATGTSFSAHNPSNTVINTGTGSLIIKANTTVSLGNITTNNLTINADGDLTSNELQAGNVAVSQVSDTALTINGNATFNTHIANIDNTNAGGGIELLNTNNAFNGDLIFTRTGLVKLRDSTAVNLGTSNINGDFELISGGNITQSGSGISVKDITSITAINFDVDLNNSQNKFNTVNFTSTIKSLDLLSSEGNLSVGNISTTRVNENGGNIKISNTASAGLLTVGSLATAGGGADNGTQGKNGGSVTLRADGSIIIGNIDTQGSAGNDDSINNSPEYNGGQGGDVSITSTTSSISLGEIITDGGNGDADDSGNNDDANGGNAGNIIIKGSEIELTKSLFARGGRLKDHGANPDKNNGAGGTVILDGDVKINNSISPIKIDSTLVETVINNSAIKPARPGNVTIIGNIVAETSYISALTINSAAFIFSGKIGEATKSLGDFSITSTQSIGATGLDIYAKSLVVNSAGFTAGNVFTSRAGENAGNVTITSTGDVNLGAVDAQGATTDNGGTVDITGRSVTIGSVNTSGVIGGAITVTAVHSSQPKSITIKGDLDAKSTSGQAAINLKLENSNSVGSINFNSTSFLSSNVTLVSSGASDTVKGPNTINNWTFSATDAGRITGENGKEITFTNFKNITGGSGVDTFNLSHNISSTINGGGDADIFNITVTALDAIVNGGNDADTFNINSVTTTKLSLDGGTGADIFNVNSTGNIIATLTGGGGTDTINSANRVNTWVLGADGTPENNERLNDTLAFSGIENVKGNEQKDTFSFVGTREVTGTVDADSSGVINSLEDEVTVSGDGDINFSAGNFLFFGVRNAEVLRSSGGGKLTVSSNAVDIINWNFSNEKSVAKGSDTVKISGFTSYEGGMGNDQFQVDDNFAFQNLVNGGAGENTFTLFNSTEAYAIAIDATYKAGSDVTLTGFDSITSNSHVDSSLELVSGVNTWNIIGLDEGTVSNLAEGEVIFSGVANLIGGSAADSFSFGSSGFISGSIDGGDGVDSITARASNTLWTIDGVNSGNIQTVDDAITYLSVFTKIENLIGTESNDIFSFSPSGRIGSAEGKGGTDTADLSLIDARTITIGNALEFAFSGVEVLKADISKDFTLATSSSADWEIDNSDGISDGSVEGIKFVGFKYLQGSAEADTFNINTDFAGTISGMDGSDIFNIKTIFTGSLSGGNGADQFVFFDDGEITGTANADSGTDVIDLTKLSMAIPIIINGSTLLGVTNIERVIADSSKEFTLATSSGANTWRIERIGVIDGTVAGIEFSGFKNLLGGTGADTFDLYTNFTGIINGMDGDDVFNIRTNVTGSLQGSAGADSFIFYSGSVANADGGSDLSKDIVDLRNLNTAIPITVAGSTIHNVTNIERVVADSLKNFTLTTNSGTNTWRIESNGVIDGTVAGIEFVGFKNLHGGVGVDIFDLYSNFTGTISGLAGDDIFNIRTNITGSLQGGAGTDSFVFYSGNVTTADGGNDSSIDIVDLRNLTTAIPITIGTNGIHNVTNIERVVADSAKDFTLATSSGANTWRIEKNDEIDGTVAGIEFVGFTNLHGSAGVDTFDLYSSFTGTINGMAGDDIFNIRTNFTGSLHGDDGADSFFFFDGGSIDVANDGRAAAGDDGSKDVVDLSNIQADTTVAFTGSTINNVTQIKRVVANKDYIFTLDSNAASNTWTISSLNEGTVGNLEFANFSALEGGSGVDIFNLNANFSGIIEGFGGADVFNLNTSITGDIRGGIGADRFVFANAGSIGAGGKADGGTDADSSKDVVELSGINQDRTVVINGFTIHNVNNVERVIANSNRTFTLDAGSTSTANNWRIYDVDGVGNNADGLNDGSVAGIEFINFKRLLGGTGADTFTFETDFNGSVHGGEGEDIFNIGTAVTGALRGENGADRFVFTNNGSVTNADAGNDSSKDTLDLSNIAAPTTVTLTEGNRLYNVSSINRVIANDAYTFTLATDLPSNTWTISDFDSATGTLSDGKNDGVVAGVEFVDFKILKGGSGIDIFNLHSDFSGTIDALGGDDTFNIYTAISGYLYGGNGGDRFVFFEGGSIDSANGGGADAGSDINKDIADFGNLPDGSIINFDGAALHHIAGVERVIGHENKHFTLAAISGVNNWQITGSDSGDNFGDGANDGVVNGIQFINFKKLQGGTGNDAYTIRMGGTIEFIHGGTGDNTLVGRDALNTWRITSANSGNLSVINQSAYVASFENIQNLTGGSLADEFIIDAAIGNLVGNNGSDRFVFNSTDNAGSAISIDGGSGDDEIVGRNTDNTWSTTGDNAGNVSVTNGAVYVTKFSDVQKLIGGSGADVFNINHEITNSVQAGDGDNTFNVNTNVGDLFGGTGNDQFNFGAAGRARNVNGGGGINSLQGRDAENIWTVTASNSGNIRIGSNEYVENFSNMHILHGGSNNDTFNINAAAGSVFGNDGDDAFSFAGNNNGIANLIDGGNGENTLRGRNQNSIWTITGTNSGSVSITSPNTYVSSFNKIKTIIGNADSDTLAALNQENSWTVNGSNRGTLHATSTPEDAIAFEGMENLLGNQSVDLFTFTASGNLTGLLDGGSTDSKNFIEDALNLSAITGNLRVELGSQLTDSLNVVNVEEISASESASNDRILMGASDIAYRWRITGKNQGTVESVENPLVETSVKFINFNDIRGGSNSDRFNIVQGEITKRIDGGSGIDLVDYSQRRENFEIELGGSGGIGVTGIHGIEGVVGNSGTGSGFSSIIKVNSGNNDWEIGTTSGTLGDGINDGSITVNGNKVTFENFTNLIGGSGRDTFQYLANGQWIGTLDGQEGTNIINASLSTRDQQFVLDGALDIGTKFKGMSQLTGNANTNSTLIGTSQANTWEVNAQGNGKLNNLDFRNVANLQGGVSADIFNISDLSWLTGVIDGGGGTGIDTVNLQGFNAAVVVAVDSQTLADINIVNVESINANAELSNRLIGHSNGNEWHINAINAGILNETINFTGFANLTGSELADLIVLDNSAATLTGHLDMGAGQDVLDMSASARNVTVQLNSAGNPVTAGVISVKNIEEVKGATNYSNHLIGDNYINNWVIDDVDMGRVSSAETGTTNFTQFKHLTGGSQDDLFIFEALGKATGLVDGGAHTVRDIVDLSKSNNASVFIASTGDVSGFNKIEKYIGNNIDSKFTAANIENSWSLSGTNRGTLNGTIEFENFGMLAGGNRRDEFSINNAIISGSIDSGDGDDIFNIQASAIAGKITAGNGDDRFTFIISAGADGTANIDGGDGNDRLTVEGGDTGYKVTHQSGLQEYVSASNNTYSILYSKINNVFDNVVAEILSIFGTTSADVFRLQTARYSTNDLNTVNYMNKANLMVNGAVDDRVIVDGIVDVASTVTFNNVRVFAENQGRIQARSLELVNTGDVGSASSRLNTTVNELSLSATNGGVFLEEQDALVLKNFNVSNTGIVDLKVGGNVSTLNPLSYTGALNVESMRGNIDLGNNNLLSGVLNLKANGNVSLGNLLSLSIVDLTAQNANLSSGASIKGVGAFSVSGLATLNATNDITLINASNDFNQVAITQADSAEIFDRNGFTSTGMAVANTLGLRSSGNIIIGTTCTTDCANSSGISAKHLKIQSDALVTVTKNISAADTVTIESQGLTVNDAITSKQFTLNAGNGNLLLNESGSLLGQDGNSIDLFANNIEQHSTIVSNGNVKVTTVGDIVMAERAVTESLTGSVELNSRSLQLGQIRAVSGSVLMNVQGAITDGNGAAANVVASVWQADALSGIGKGLGQDGDFDAIETEVGRLSVRNAGSLHSGGQGSTINIANANALVIEQLRNNGHITIYNNGEVVLDNTNARQFDITNPDARLQGGAINANTGSLTQLIMNVTGGGVRAEGEYIKKIPDIIADISSFKISGGYDFGERSRKIVMHIPEYYAQESRYSYREWHIARPKTILDLSKVPPDSFISGRDQLIQIEGLSEIDPAIFTNLRNYVHDEVAILLPMDQRFDDEDEVY